MDWKPNPNNLSELCDLILVAGGSGQRFQSKVLKQFDDLNGRPLYLWSFETFLNWPRLGRAVVVVPEDWVAPVRESFDLLSSTREVCVVAGGPTRQLSARAGLQELTRVSQNPWVMVHDAARPALSHELLERIWNAREPKVEVGPDEAPISGVIPGVLPTDTIKNVVADRQTGAIAVAVTFPRESLRVIQTPQLFLTSALVEAHDALSDDPQAIDDASMVEKLGGKVLVVDGEYDNVKITFPEDKERVSNWLRKRHPQV